MWGYAEGNETAITIVVAVVVIAAVAYVFRRLFVGRGGGRGGSKK